jgi:hypothetical protein
VVRSPCPDVLEVSRRPLCDVQEHGSREAVGVDASRRVFGALPKLEIATQSSSDYDDCQWMLIETSGSIDQLLPRKWQSHIAADPCVLSCTFHSTRTAPAVAPWTVKRRFDISITPVEFILPTLGRIRSDEGRASTGITKRGRGGLT